VSPYPGPGAWQSNTAYIARYQHALSYLASVHAAHAWDPQGIDGKYGPHTKSAVQAFQTDHGLASDGQAGAATAAAIDAALASS
jgi:peptidoglycan hydrolase-like protein with peptidoglycan-binding domain